ncbi:MAG TPA: aminoacyl-tRNA hydrolase [Deltaproteobacteria bacterium]|nr:aminoacyl-tRNA hydrolase [Deltaproteobacteria bacterium]HCP47862.1 aminoacyl-tRNA hydrolase [Deltaproteobacteria bacterium]
MSDKGLRVRPDLIIAEAELEESSSRAGGPGGQHVNKTETRITLRWNLATSTSLREWQRNRLRQKLAPRLTRDGEIVLHASSSRSQKANRLEVRRRLVQLLQEAMYVKPARKATKPSRGARERRMADKKRRSQNKKLRGRVRGDEG